MSEPTMTELDHLRELLDEEGVSYLSHKGDITIGYYTEDPHSVIEAMDHSLQVTGLTAEQAMRALGHTTTVDETERIGIIELENAKLRKLCKACREFAYDLFDEFIGEPEMDDDFMELADRMRELGVEVDE